MATVLKQTLFRALKKAGKIIRDNIDRPKKISHKNKSPINLVTWVDHAADKLIIRTIRKQFPNHQFLTEEEYPKGSKNVIPATATTALAVRQRLSGGKRSGIHGSPLTTAGMTSPYKWIIDPLDGTTNFAHGFPQVCVSIGLEWEGSIILGGVYDPCRDELFWAEKGRGAFLKTKKGTRRIRVSTVPHLTQALLITGFPYDRRERVDFYLSYLKAFMGKIQGIRRAGAAALDLCWVACGRVDGYWEWRLKPWDVAAGKIIVEEAGGRLSDYSGGPYGIYGDQTLSSNGRIHGEMLTILRTV